MRQQNHQNSVTVCIRQATYNTIDLATLLQPLGGMATYVHKGEKVLLKVNLLSATTPEKAVVTNPLLVRKTAEAVLDVGATPIIGDSPAGQFTKRRLRKVYEKAGLLALSRDLGIELNYDTRTTTVPIPLGVRLTTTPLCNFILNADKIIALPKIKTHSYMIMTLATKIMFGAVPGLTKAKYHALYPRKSAFANMLLDVLSVASPDLLIMDGIIGMQGEGPGAGIPVHLGVLLAADHPIALDIAVCRLLQIEPVGVPTLKQAKLRKLWPPHITYPQLTPDDVAFTGFILPRTTDYLLTGKKTPQKSPTVTVRCTSCGECEDICPKHAITNTPGKATIDYDKCIRCYCCQEICPEKAVILEDRPYKPRS
jgi:uncharacterized protein (DUF362 family)/NAD-dependent dihydropyrimidine dehydrogenase PreA subunit